jgi:hypothetical protein
VPLICAAGDRWFICAYDYAPGPDLYVLVGGNDDWTVEQIHEVFGPPTWYGLVKTEPIDPGELL